MPDERAGIRLPMKSRQIRRDQDEALPPADTAREETRRGRRFSLRTAIHLEEPQIHSQIITAIRRIQPMHQEKTLAHLRDWATHIHNEGLAERAFLFGSLINKKGRAYTDASDIDLMVVMPPAAAPQRFICLEHLRTRVSSLRTTLSDSVPKLISVVAATNFEHTNDIHKTVPTFLPVSLFMDLLSGKLQELSPKKSLAFFKHLSAYVQVLQQAQGARNTFLKEATQDYENDRKGAYPKKLLRAAAQLSYAVSDSQNLTIEDRFDITQGAAYISHLLYCNQRDSLDAKRLLDQWHDEGINGHITMATSMQVWETLADTAREHILTAERWPDVERVVTMSSSAGLESRTSDREAAARLASWRQENFSNCDTEALKCQISELRHSTKGPTLRDYGTVLPLIQTLARSLAECPNDILSFACGLGWTPHTAAFGAEDIFIVDVALTNAGHVDRPIEPYHLENAQRVVDAVDQLLALDVSADLGYLDTGHRLALEVSRSRSILVSGVDSKQNGFIDIIRLDGRVLGRLTGRTGMLGCVDFVPSTKGHIVITAAQREHRYLWGVETSTPYAHHRLPTGAHITRHSPIPDAPEKALLATEDGAIGTLNEERWTELYQLKRSATLLSIVSLPSDPSRHFLLTCEEVDMKLQRELCIMEFRDGLLAEQVRLGFSDFGLNPENVKRFAHDCSTASAGDSIFACLTVDGVYLCIIDIVGKKALGDFIEIEAAAEETFVLSVEDRVFAGATLMKPGPVHVRIFELQGRDARLCAELNGSAKEKGWTVTARPTAHGFEVFYVTYSLLDQSPRKLWKWKSLGSTAPELLATLPYWVRQLSV